MKNSNGGNGWWWVLWVALIAGKIYFAYHKSHNEFKPYIPPLPRATFNSGFNYESPFEKYKSLSKSEAFEFGNFSSGNVSGTPESGPIPKIVPQP